MRYSRCLDLHYQYVYSLPSVLRVPGRYTDDDKHRILSIIVNTFDIELVHFAGGLMYFTKQPKPIKLLRVVGGTCPVTSFGGYLFFLCFPRAFDVTVPGDSKNACVPPFHLRHPRSFKPTASRRGTLIFSRGPPIRRSEEGGIPM